jgi:hypothetical protein
LDASKFALVDTLYLLPGIGSIISTLRVRITLNQTEIADSARRMDKCDVNRSKASWEFEASGTEVWEICCERNENKRDTDALVLL